MVGFISTFELANRALKSIDMTGAEFLSYPEDDPNSSHDSDRARLYQARLGTAAILLVRWGSDGAPEQDEDPGGQPYSVYADFDPPTPKAGEHTFSAKRYAINIDGVHSRHEKLFISPENEPIFALDDGISSATDEDLAELHGVLNSIITGEFEAVDTIDTMLIETMDVPGFKDIYT